MLPLPGMCYDLHRDPYPADLLRADWRACSAYLELHTSLTSGLPLPMPRSRPTLGPSTTRSPWQLGGVSKMARLVRLSVPNYGTASVLTSWSESSCDWDLVQIGLH